VHPRQVGVANAGFAPTAQELAWARKALAADIQARALGLGATMLDGRMIDLPIVERARLWLARADKR
jgi:citrate lyase subunit beta/citryl-CoA lyase